MREANPSAVLLLAAALLAGTPAAGQGSSALSEDDGTPGPIRVGSVFVDADARSVIATGWVNQVVGPIELLACGRAGKTHESVFVLDLNPVDLQAAILLLGIKPGTPPTGLGAGPPTGPQLDIWVEWDSEGQTVRMPAGQFVYNVQAERPMTKTRWYFTGSLIENGEFKALAEESLVATYWDPWAMLNIAHPAGTNDDILYVNKDAVPPLGTSVTLYLAPRPERRWWEIWKTR